MNAWVLVLLALACVAWAPLIDAGLNLPAMSLAWARPPVSRRAPPPNRSESAPALLALARSAPGATGCRPFLTCAWRLEKRSARARNTHLSGPRLLPSSCRTLQRRPPSSPAGRARSPEAGAVTWSVADPASTGAPSLATPPERDGFPGSARRLLQQAIVSRS